MCLDVEWDDELQPLSDGRRTARKDHRCYECSRVVEPGERYRYWTFARWGEGIEQFKMCAHCEATIDLGVALTGCPPGWYWEKIHDLDPDEGGFVGDILANHDLSVADRARVLRMVVQRRRRWRRPNGELYPLPETPVAV